ncbi:hypothetical protein FJV41_31210 [Myxococcus llanfairpwllgwyngyllgogerychwyrndrobwllllantysiliogogogochensis]|uniref:Uncharacterized protein n=1 Tax=Myxococcus llanfairpwllgwyngyllgogerychwyrndrobwllllantysiliogogogochensis TaxID=2590453 RepID=A0A540WST0_9BACT|nr:hypothetical protein [Myxococcus llanfairpwllgwyngyllgogerychwyrndrobwllllantysiliogogogochensis]TQF11997.1 hypothetical protein FJV41_31210 [Myxococcus llanfairpwllgwyngyllgogerychwyrndrobwllllantysiliogogogochensis]
MKILSLRFQSTSSHETLAALTAACRPFGSLTGPELPHDEVPRLMVGAQESDNLEDVARAVGALAAALRKTDADQWSELRVTGHSVGLVTPTSRTQIRLTGSTTSWLYVEVDFGEAGSADRAGQILYAAHEAGVEFTARAAEGMLSASQVRALVRERAEGMLTWVESEVVRCPTGSYAAELPHLRRRVAELRA